LNFLIRKLPENELCWLLFRFHSCQGECEFTELKLVWKCPNHFDGVRARCIEASFLNSDRSTDWVDLNKILSIIYLESRTHIKPSI
jgi:hypothetical protein